MIEAVVQTGGFETAYRRAGRGGVVLLVDASAAASPFFERLAARFRIIAPTLPAELDGTGAAPPELMEAWLRGLIDGLGLDRPALVCDVVLGSPALRFVMGDPDRVDRLALLRRPGSDVNPDPGLLAAARASGRAVLVVDVGDPDGADGRGDTDAEAPLLEFLAAGVRR